MRAMLHLYCELAGHSEQHDSIYSNDSEVELQCEMTLYIRPAEGLQWFDGCMMITSGNNSSHIVARSVLTTIRVATCNTHISWSLPSV